MLKGETRGKYLGVLCKNQGCTRFAKAKDYCRSCYQKEVYNKNKQEG